jgi:erythromycin esterase-like protein
VKTSRRKSRRQKTNEGTAKTAQRKSGKQNSRKEKAGKVSTTKKKVRSTVGESREKRQMQKMADRYTKANVGGH